MNREFIEALDGLAKEKRISKDMLLETIESALETAYKKNYGSAQDDNVRVVIDEETGDIAVLLRKDIVEEVENDNTEMSIDEAHMIDERYEVGDSIEFSVTPKDFGRIATRTASQVIKQKISEKEKNMIFEDYSARVGEVITGTVQHMNGETIYINIGRTEGILPAKEQVHTERLRVHQRVKVYITDVKDAKKGTKVFLSRSHPGLVKKLFELEVPEIQDGSVEIKGIAREAGSRTKMGVYAEDENIDPVGACVGTRGGRVQAVVDELNGEKIDIIFWSDDPEELISNVLSPADCEEVIIEDLEGKIATAIVPDYQLSLAIGKQGQNVRLAAKVSGWKIDIKSHTQYFGDEDGDDYFYEDEEPIEDEVIEEEAEVEEVEVEEAEEAEEAEVEEAEEEAEAEEPEEAEEAEEEAEAEEPEEAEEAEEEAEAEEPEEVEEAEEEAEAEEPEEAEEAEEPEEVEEAEEEAEAEEPAPEEEKVEEE